MSLPKELNYNTQLDSILDGTTNKVITLLPSNGSIFSLSNSGSQIYFDFPSSDYMIPDTLMLSYSYKVTNPLASKQRGTPFTSVFNRLEVISGSQTIQTIPQYNQLTNVITNLTYSTSNKISNSIGLGYKVSRDANGLRQAETNNHGDGAILAANEIGNVSGPIRCCLSEAQNPLPLIMMESMRISMTLDSIANVFCPGVASVAADYPRGILFEPLTGIPTDFSIYDLQLSYNTISFPSAVTEQIRMAGSPLLIKTQGFSSVSQILPASTSSVVESVYNVRYASIRNLLLLNSTGSSTNGMFDSFNLSPQCSYSFYINSQQYPNLPITKQKNAYIELKKLTGSAFDTIANNLAINVNEYNYNLGDVTTLSEPAKFYVGCSVQVSPFSSGRLLSGISSQNSALSVRLNIETPLPVSVNSTLVINYDMIIVVDPMTRSTSIKM